MRDRASRKRRPEDRAAWRPCSPRYGCGKTETAAGAAIDAGGTITHHHAVGRDRMPWYLKQRPDLFGAALAAAKSRLDPAGLLNPGVLVPARPPE